MSFNKITTIYVTVIINYVNVIINYVNLLIIDNIRMPHYYAYP